MNRLFARLIAALLMVFVLELRAEPPAISAANGNPSPALRDAVILIIRHAEKPESGFELSAAGRMRAEAYVDYFSNLTLDSLPLKPDYLCATADSAGSHRPRLTLEPLSKALGLKIDARYKDKDFQKLADEILSKPHGKRILIAWHHGEIANLARALGAEPDNLLPDGKWPNDVFCWLLELRYDHNGRLIPGATKRINERLMPGDANH
jgi:broad specificity phosphatase PhoE